MAEDFKPIETQEQLNAVIGERIARVEKKASEETAGLRKEIETLTQGRKEDATKIADLEKSNKEFESKVKTYEAAAVKARIAKEYGIPDGLTDRLKGETEEELKQDAENLKKLLPTSIHIKSTTHSTGAGDREENLKGAYAALAQNLTSKGE
ncbi:MAG: hypothetical protein K6F63_03915 [Lachnospiraceae bacterium]|nr:hypothetical protein [Lachnospiraceae bacterium]